MEEEEDEEALMAELELEGREYTEHELLASAVMAIIGGDEETKKSIIDQSFTKMEAVLREGNRRREARAFTRMDRAVKEWDKRR